MPMVDVTWIELRKCYNPRAPKVEKPELKGNQRDSDE